MAAETKHKAATPNATTSKQEFDLQQSMHKAEDFYYKNKNVINIAVVAVIVIVGGFFAYNRFIKAPNEKKAQEMVFHAQQYFAVDSFRLALNGDGNNYGFLQVIDKYGGTKVGNLAKYSAGVCYVRLGEFQKGIDLLKSFNANDKLVQAYAYGLTGDAYMELNKTEDGIDYYKKAGHYSDNELTAPLYLFRAGLALQKAGKTDEAIAIYKEIKEKYPQTNEGREMDKYLAKLGVVRE
ncbi:MAG TPA: tetratricopeptide repeat protein [Chitinophaga sp.]|jgi:tetratricopeptide (TPR) repeat protein|uniref:tetratricopeptide repeat protein n=1 Tax=Chitinophaga sp. TaxID=1869181 RepID=UPI002DBE3814|nr:tetratricopeptide repeat protein [Chitinophaga sp.]HEU4554100.1 tetratricopeptide repeat protein [Chitinophaga sp.]